MEENRSLKYIKSKDVRAYIKRTGLQFSDSEVGTLLFHVQAANEHEGLRGRH